MKKLFFAILIFLGVASSDAQITKTFNVVLRSNFGTDTMWDGLDVPIYSMNHSLSAEPKIPARVIYCNEGDSVVLNALSLAQGEHHTIHLHGLDVDTRNDGDPMTSFWLEHLQDTTYSFKATHAGTYLYHCHVADVVHVQMGMYGLVVVKSANGVNTAWTGGPAFDKEVHWLTSELDSSWHFNVPTHDPATDTVNIPPYVPTYFLVNGKSEWQLHNNDSVSIKGLVGQKIYLRLANIGFYNNKVVFPSHLSAVVIDSDGRPLPNPINGDTVYVQPGERYGVMLSPSQEIIDSIPIHFQNMNTGLTENTQWAPLQIQSSVSTNSFNFNSDIKIYPNPFSNRLVIKTGVNSDYLVSISDVSGKQILIDKFSGSDYLLNSENISSGIYFLRLQSKNFLSESYKLIKIH
ncbi:MAG: multicopper oxidase domain-containing protein [Bacteroidota bacterium]